jgi:hypothetical protein
VVTSLSRYCVIKRWVSYVICVSLWGLSISKQSIEGFGWSHMMIGPGYDSKAFLRVTLTAQLVACI